MKNFGDNAIKKLINLIKNNCALKEHVHNYAGSNTPGGSANSVANEFTVKVNGGSTEGTNLFTFNGSATKIINLKAGTNITLSADSSGNITINSTASGGTTTGEVGVEIPVPTTTDGTQGRYGIYCDGNVTPNDVNSVQIYGSLDCPYKRFRIYVRCPGGLGCTEMPFDNMQETANSTFSTSYQGGIVFPTGDNTDGATNNYIYKIHWAIRNVSGALRLQVTDSGWLNLGTGSVGGTNYANNSTTGISSAAPTWNQRHNDNYSIYKIVGYEI